MESEIQEKTNHTELLMQLYLDIKELKDDWTEIVEEGIDIDNIMRTYKFYVKYIEKIDNGDLSFDDYVLFYIAASAIHICRIHQNGPCEPVNVASHRNSFVWNITSSISSSSILIPKSESMLVSAIDKCLLIIVLSCFLHYTSYPMQNCAICYMLPSSSLTYGLSCCL